MDDVIFQDGACCLKISVAGIDRDTGTVDSERFRLTVYAYDAGPPVSPLFTAELDVSQATHLYDYLDSISIVRERGGTRSGRFVEIRDRVPREVIEAFLGHPDLFGDPEVVRSVLRLNPELTRAIIESELTAFDVESLAYRRRQLAVMRRLLDDRDFFAQVREEFGVSGKEGVWQRFFEENQWIFGLALHYVIGEGVCPDRLEQVVAGHSVAGAGKRADALLRTRGILKSLCYVEIKTHETLLLHPSPYRPEVWRPSDELAGAIAQSQKTVQLAIEHLRTKLELPSDVVGEAGGFFNYAPRSVVVCGSLGEFDTGTGTNGPKFGSFELLRRSIHSPDIVTFDELHERAAAIVESRFSARNSSTGA